MARGRASSSHPGSRLWHELPKNPELCDIDSPFPEELLHFLRERQVGAASDPPQEPPRKRAKLQQAAADAIPVGNASLTLTRPADPDSSVSGSEAPVQIQDAHRHLNFYVAPHQEALILESSSKHSKGTGSYLNVELPLALPSSCSHGVQAATRLLGSIRADPAAEGALWATVSIAYSRHDRTDSLALTFQVHWTQAKYAIRDYRLRHFSELVIEAFMPARCLNPKGSPDKFTRPKDFYEVAHVTNSSSKPIPHQYSIEGLEATPYPFQQRALHWLWNREGVDLCHGSEGEETALGPLTKGLSRLPFSFSSHTDLYGQRYYLSNLYHLVTREIAPFLETEDAVRGGILAEEMGLGKTIEIIALILTHTRPHSPPTIFDQFLGETVTPTAATLIITPPVLKDQWLSELKKHAPSLRVMEYQGMKGRKHDPQVIHHMAMHDVVVTTYAVLRTEIHFADPPPSRSMRHERVHQRPRSPLVKLSWWRVCLDEAQLVESRVSNTAKVARLIPRVNAWAITGTPVKSEVKDLWGLLLFLRYEPFASSSAIWDALCGTHKAYFSQLFNRLALRHTKRVVRSELTLPPQKRHLITMRLNAVEEQNYKEQFEHWASRCGLSPTGAPLRQDWDPRDPAAADSMRNALNYLRRIVLHPEMALGTKRNVLRSIDDVLQTMIDQSDANIKTETRGLILHLLNRGKLYDRTPSVKKTLEDLEPARAMAEKLIRNCREQITKELEANNGPATYREGTRSTDEGDDQVDETNPRVREYRRELRSTLTLLHAIVFFIASAHYQVKSGEEVEDKSDEYRRLDKLENECYVYAKELRQEILQEPRKKAQALMQKFREADDSLVDIPDLQPPAYQLVEGGTIVGNFEFLCESLNTQADLLDGWRRKISSLLRQPLVDSEIEEEVTGQEYEDSTQIQDDINSYTTALRAALADRQEALTGLRNFNALQEAQADLSRAKKDGTPATLQVLEKLFEEREDALQVPVAHSFRSIISELRALATKNRQDASAGNSRAAAAQKVAQGLLQQAQIQSAEQSKTSEALERELNRFVTAANARIDYYRSLQAISDYLTNGDPDQRDVERLAQESRDQEAQHHGLISAAEGRHRFLLHLREMGHNSHDKPECLLCLEKYSMGVLTDCGHSFHRECFLTWWHAKRRCPICKRALKASELRYFVHSSTEMKVRLENMHTARSVMDQQQAGLYSKFSETKLAAIENIKLAGVSFGTKIDNLIKHLMWIREEDPGAKSIVFTQFEAYKEVLQHAMVKHGVGVRRFNSADDITQFKEDASIETFILGARDQASGLNLVNASHVFICEPMLNTALELQAIARVDRIGQEHETTVWLYVVEGTVEESVYKLSVRRRLEHMNESARGRLTRPADASFDIEEANSQELQQAKLSDMMQKDKNGGEHVDKGDLWECLFGHVADGLPAEGSGSGETSSNLVVRGFLAGEAADARQNSNL